MGCKEKTKAHKGIDDSQLGDSYAWIAVERHSKLVLCWQLGRRTGRNADAFAEKLDSATSGGFQVSTDGFQPYIDSLGYHVGGRSDYGQIIKEFGYNAEGERRYSPPKLIALRRRRSSGTLTSIGSALRGSSTGISRSVPA